MLSVAVGFVDVECKVEQGVCQGSSPELFLLMLQSTEKGRYLTKPVVNPILRQIFQVGPPSGFQVHKLPDSARVVELRAGVKMSWIGFLEQRTG